MNDATRIRIGERLREIRLNKQLSATEVSYDIRIPQPRISDVECGRAGEAQVLRLGPILANYYGISWQNFLRNNYRVRDYAPDAPEVPETTHDPEPQRPQPEYTMVYHIYPKHTVRPNSTYAQVR